jgi:hypothetical protein
MLNSAFITLIPKKIEDIITLSHEEASVSNRTLLHVSNQPHEEAALALDPILHLSLYHFNQPHEEAALTPLQTNTLPFT